MTDIFQEVSEDMRREKAQKLWAKYGNYVLGGALAVVIGVSGYVAYQHYLKQQAEATGARFQQAVRLFVPARVERLQGRPDLDRDRAAEARLCGPQGVADQDHRARRARPRRHDGRNRRDGRATGSARAAHTRLQCERNVTGPVPTRDGGASAHAR